MLSKLLHLSLYDLGWLMWGWVFGREYFVTSNKYGHTTTTTGGATSNVFIPAQWEKKPRRFRFRVPKDAMDADY